MKKYDLLNITFDELCETSPVYYLDKSKNISQSPDWHPEGNLLNHIRIVFNRAQRTKDINLVLAAIFHDLGKIDTTVKHPIIPNKWTAKAHEKYSTQITNDNKKWIQQMGGDFDVVKYIVEQHMRIKYMDEMREHKKKIFMEHPFFPMLEKFSELDNMSIDYSNDLN